MTKLNNKNVIQLAMQIMSLATVWHFIESQSIAGEVAQILGSYEVQAKKENPKVTGLTPRFMMAIMVSELPIEGGFTILSPLFASLKLVPMILVPRKKRRILVGVAL